MSIIQEELKELSTEPEAYEPPTKTSAPAPASGGYIGDSLVGLLTERLDMYQLATASAKSVGDNSKARRMDRGRKVDDLPVHSEVCGGIFPNNWK